MKTQETKESLITKIKVILSSLGVRHFLWSDLNIDYIPILQEDKFNSDFTYGLDYIEVEGVSGSNCFEDGYWTWDELPQETIQTIYDEMSEYKMDL